MRDQSEKEDEEEEQRLWEKILKFEEEIPLSKSEWWPRFEEWEELIPPMPKYEDFKAVLESVESISIP